MKPENFNSPTSKVAYIIFNVITTRSASLVSYRASCLGLSGGSCVWLRHPSNQIWAFPVSNTKKVIIKTAVSTSQAGNHRMI